MPIRASLHFHIWTKIFNKWKRILCQCPFGLLFISTMDKEDTVNALLLCQCPFGLLFISTHTTFDKQYASAGCVNAHSGFSSFPRRYSKRATSKCGFVSMPIRAFLHFYLKNGVCFHGGNGCVNALLGFPSFLQHPSGTRRNKAFSRPFLQVFIWKFWKQGFSDCILYCSQFVHILIQITPAHKTSVFLLYYAFSVI